MTRRSELENVTNGSNLEPSQAEQARHLLSNDAQSDPLDQNIYAGHLHAHSRLSDGTLAPTAYFSKAKNAGLHFVALTEHNHVVLEQKDKSGGPVVAAQPEQYGQLFTDAKNISENGKFIALSGMEMGSIGKTGKEGSGVNHINMFEMPVFFEALLNKQEGFFEIMRKAPEIKRNFSATASNLFTPRPYTPSTFNQGQNFSGEFKPPVTETRVIKYPNTNYKEMLASVDTLKDTSGKRPVIQLNHPRYKDDENSQYPPNVRGKDYGTKSFDNDEEWRQEFGKYACLIEVVRGTGNIDTNSYQGMIDKGLYVSPTYGPDDHFGKPETFKGATLIQADTLTMDELLDAMRAHKTGATTDKSALQCAAAVEGKHAMGKILEDNEVKDLSFAVKITTEIDPRANYKMKLWGDTKLGDYKLAQMVDSKVYSGEELLKTSGRVEPFKHVAYTHNQGNAFYIEIERTEAGASISAEPDELRDSDSDLETHSAARRQPRRDDNSSGNRSQAERLFTAPVWVVPEAEAKRLRDVGLLEPKTIKTFAETQSSLPATMRLPNARIYKD